jgi:hypothetical protein
MITPVSPTFLKQEAKKIKKNQGLSMSKALDEVSKKYGFSNYRHYLNVYELNRTQSTSSKEVLLNTLSLEKDIVKKMEMVISFIKDFKIPFRDVLEILKSFHNSEEAIQAICERLNLMKNEIQTFLFNDFLTDEGQSDINLRAPNFIAKEVSISDLIYELGGNMLYIDGNYVLTTESEYEFMCDEDDPIRKDERFKDREFEGSFEIKIDKNKKITMEHSSMSTNDRLTPMRAFTEEDVEEHYKRFPEDRGQFDDIVVLDNTYDNVTRCLLNKEPLTGKTLELALGLVDVHGDDEQSNFVKNIGVKMKAGQPLDEYEHHMVVDVLMMHAQLGS